MANKLKNGSDSGRNASAVRMLIGSVAIAVIAVVFIVFSRGYINCANRMDFIARRRGRQQWDITSWRGACTHPLICKRIPLVIEEENDDLKKTDTS